MGVSTAWLGNNGGPFFGPDVRGYRLQIGSGDDAHVGSIEPGREALSDERNYVFGTLTKEAIEGMSGKEVLQAIVDRQLPQAPISEYAGFWLVEIGDGFAAFEGETGAHLLNPAGSVHGGWALTLIDSACACAAHSLLPPGTGYASVETKANFSRSIRKDTGRVRCVAHVAGRGNQIMSAEARLEDAAGELLAHGTSTIMVLAARR
jgi:uncharacterized protein (TIGR00369 family)